MNVELDRDRYLKLLILARLSGEGIDGLIDGMWTDRLEFISEEIAVEDFQALAKDLRELEA